MTHEQHNLTRLAPWAVAMMLIFATDALAQTAAPRITVASSEDMRLWSFGDCDRRFPYVNTDEHRECVRVVGSAEARDARALRVCEVSHETDHEEIDRCKSAYLGNKEKAAKEGVAANSSAAPQAPPSDEMMRRVKAITSAAVEAKRAAAVAAAPPEDDEEPAAPMRKVEPESSSVTTVGLVLLVVGFLGYMFTIVRKKQAQSA
jgi:hypothetical protein